MSDTAAARRAERRKQKILQNSDDRMKRIFGGQNYHEEHLKLTTNPDPDTNENITPLVRNFPTSENNILTENPFLLGLNPATENVGRPSVVPPVKTGTFWIFWTILGMAIRFVLATNYSWVFGDNCLIPYGLTFSVVNFLLSQKEQASAGGIFDVIGLFAGLDSKRIARIKFTLSLITQFFNTLISYFAGFMLLDVVLTNL